MAKAAHLNKNFPCIFFNSFPYPELAAAYTAYFPLQDLRLKYMVSISLFPKNRQLIILCIHSHYLYSICPSYEFMYTLQTPCIFIQIGL